MTRRLLTFATCLLVCSLLGLFFHETRLARAAGPRILTQDECEALIGGQNGCPTKNCQCASQACVTTNPNKPCPTTSSTCTDDGNGGCVLITLSTGWYCGQPNTNNPNGCGDVGGAVSCATTWTGGPVFVYGQWSCTYPANTNCNTQGGTCGQPLYTCVDY